MRHILNILIICILPIICFGGDIEIWEVADSNVSTNTSPSADDTITSGYLTGYLEALALTVTTDEAAPTVTVYLATSPSYGNGQENVIFSQNITASGFYILRKQASGNNGAAISGEYDRIPLYRDKLVFKTYNKNTTSNVAVKCVVYYDK